MQTNFGKNRPARGRAGFLGASAAAICVAGIGAAIIGSASAQSFGSGSIGSASSPFARLFGGGAPGTNSPVDLQFRIGGEDEGLERAIRNGSLLTGALQEGRVTAQDMLAAARADYARLLAILYDNGYYSNVIEIRLDGVEASTIAPLDAPEVVRQVVVSIDPGPAFRYSRAQIAPLAPGTELPNDYRAGEVASTSVMRQAANAGVEGWRQQSHAKAEVGATDITAHHPSATLDSRIALEPGPALRFGRLTIAGNERMNLRRLNKIAGFPEGEPFDPDDLETVRQRLRRTGVFSAITLVEADNIGPGNTLDVHLTVVEQRLRRLGVGFEISSHDGANVSGYWMHRNLLGGGERLRVDAAVRDIGSGSSGRDLEFGVRIDRPATLNPDTTAYVEARAARLYEEDYDQDLGILGIGFTYHPRDELTADIGLQYRRSRVDDHEDGTTDFEVLALPMSVTWDRREPLETDAKRGFWLQGELTPFTGFDETGSGVRALGEGRFYRSFGEDDRFTFAGRGRAGSIFGPDIEGTPREYLFYSGGGSSVRGQPYQSLGVEEITGPGGAIKTGGMSVANATAEFRFQVRERIGLALFADAGRVWTEEAFGGESDWHAGAGVGVRYNTPIGPLRFDVAGPVGGDTGEGVQVYLGLGQAF
ncbi:BamA/TamA family outer membrane protein [Paracoccus sp. Z118]|uniref:autotransporter assembly complex protein TamA n=1 Tax=Paracoccus sp. Z118 TaxID=2851017 RepID=UPI001C2C9B5D|nr:BamA/TamA family outer membrane protein [Paracoccus sp. Z118]MBV0891957.1 BamA/TamA family outer membrane protein [Paracoccus sp. Z118]